MSWLKKEARGWSVVVCVVLFVVLAFFWYGLLAIFFEYFHIDFSSMNKNTVTVIGSSPLFYLLMFIVVSTEEGIAHLIPLSIVVWLKFTVREVILFSVLISLLFGYMHGNIFNILFQGMVGFIICLSFLKCGGMRSNNLKALSASIAVHYLFNFSFCMLVLYTI